MRISPQRFERGSRVLPDDELRAFFIMACLAREEQYVLGCHRYGDCALYRILWSESRALAIRRVTLLEHHSLLFCVIQHPVPVGRMFFPSRAGGTMEYFSLKNNWAAKP